MSVRLNIGDAVLVNTRKDEKGIGVIKYIGGIHGGDMISEYVGIELVEPIQTGHNGTIDGYQYFSSPNGHGFHTKLTSVIRKVSSSELVIQLRELLSLFRNRLNEKDKYIKILQSKISKSSSPRYQHGSSKSLHLVAIDSSVSGLRDIPRRESASASTTVHCVTPMTSMAPITENGMNIDFRMNNQTKRESATLTLDVIRDDLSNHSYSVSLNNNNNNNNNENDNKRKKQSKNKKSPKDVIRQSSDNSDKPISTRRESHSNVSDDESESTNTSRSSYTSCASTDYMYTYTDDELSKSQHTIKKRQSKSIKKLKKGKSKKRKSTKKHKTNNLIKNRTRNNNNNNNNDNSPKSKSKSNKRRSISKSRNSIINKIVIGAVSGINKRKKSISISKSSRKDSIIKATKNMAEIRNNIIKPIVSSISPLPISPIPVSPISPGPRSINSPLPPPPHHHRVNHNRVGSVAMKQQQFQFIPYPNLQRPQQPQYLTNNVQTNITNEHGTRSRNSIDKSSSKNTSVPFKRCGGNHKLSEPMPDHQPSLNRNRSELIKETSLPHDVPSLTHRPRSSPAVFVSPTPSHTAPKSIHLQQPQPQQQQQQQQSHNIHYSDSNGYLLDPPSLSAQTRMHSNRSSALSSQTQTTATNTMIFGDMNNINNVNNVNNIDLSHHQQQQVMNNNNNHNGRHDSLSNATMIINHEHDRSLSSIPTFYVAQQSRSRSRHSGSSHHGGIHHGNQNSNSFNNNQFLQSLHSNQSSSTITVPSQIEIWTQGSASSNHQTSSIYNMNDPNNGGGGSNNNLLNHHMHHHNNQSSPSSISPHTPCTPATPQQPGGNESTAISETQTAYFDPESFLNYRNQNGMNHQIPSYNEYAPKPINSVNSIKYNQYPTSSIPSIPSMQTMSIGTISNVSSPHQANHQNPQNYHRQLVHGLPSLNEGSSRSSSKRTGKRTNKRSLITLPSFAVSSVSTISPNQSTVVYNTNNNNHNNGNSNNHRRHRQTHSMSFTGHNHHNKKMDTMYSLSNNGFQIFGHNYNNNNNNNNNAAISK